MKIKTISVDGEYCNSYCIYVNGKRVVSASDQLSECPEDATLGRDLSFVYGIPKLLKQAYEAGKNGEPFEEEHIEKKDDDEDDL